jgi:Permuted papain-like amidase enzyme, YaeF/YiiX, C92 family
MKFSLGDWLVTKIGLWLIKNRPPRRTYLCDFERIRYELRAGDVLLIEGRNRASTLIRKITRSPWSHAALYIGRMYDIDDSELRQKIRQHFEGPSDSQLLIESLIGKGTILTPLSYYRHDNIRICRPQGLSRKDAQTIIGYTISRLGGKYNIRHVFDLARFLLPWGYFRRWHSFLFDHKPSQAIYDICSSMIADAFHSVRFPVLPIIKQDNEDGLELVQRNPRLYTPSDFDYSPYFDIIKYPFFALSTQRPYSHLPWKEGTISIDEEKDILIHQQIQEDTPNHQPSSTLEPTSQEDISKKT